MQYIFNNSVSELPIEDIQIAWYDMEHMGNCLDESFKKPEDFTIRDLMYVEDNDEKNMDKSDRTKVFVNMKDGRRYELQLVDVTGKKMSNYYDSI